MYLILLWLTISLSFWISLIGQVVMCSSGTPLLWVQAHIREAQSDLDDYYNDGLVPLDPIPCVTKKTHWDVGDRSSPRICLSQLLYAHGMVPVWPWAFDMDLKHPTLSSRSRSNLYMTLTMHLKIVALTLWKFWEIVYLNCLQYRLKIFNCFIS